MNERGIPKIIPNHVGIIPDGTRRWAMENHLEYRTAYRAAAEKLGLIIGFLFGEGVNIVSVYVLSRENLGRSQDNLQAVFEAIIFFCQDVLSPLVEKWNCTVHLAGLTELLPDEVAGNLTSVERRTCECCSRRLNLLVAYHPVDEIVYALSKGGSPQDLTSNLWVTEPVELIIRTAGVCLLSGFLPLQSSYARIYVFNKWFNDLEIQDVESALREFALVLPKYGL